MSTVTPIHFFQTLFGEPIGPGRLLLWTRKTNSGEDFAYWPNNLDEAARQACRYKNSRDVYFSVSLQSRRQAIRIAARRRPLASDLRVRGSVASATLLPALWAELVVAGLGDSRDDLPADRESALGLLEALPRPPSILVNAGGDFQAYWRLDPPLLLDTPEARRSARRLVLKLHSALAAAGAEHGWGVHQNGNLAHQLRVPGTLNHDVSPPALVKVEHFPRGPGLGDWTCRPEDFDDLPEPAAGDGAGALLRDPGTGRDRGPAADFLPIHAGCPFLQYCYDERTVLPEKELEAALEVVVCCRIGDAGGRRLAHRMCRDHPGYTRAGTDADVDQAFAAGGPVTCARIRGLGDRAAACCAGCAHAGRIEGPIVLGRRPPATSIESPPAGGTAGDGDAGRDVSENDVAESSVGGNGGVGHDVTENNVAGRPGDGRPEILISTLEHQVNDRALAALAAREPNLFQRAGILVQVVPATGGGPPRIKPLARAHLRELLARHCAFQQPAGGGPRPAHPPRWTVRALLGRGSWPRIPALDGVVETPVLRADGSVLQRRGFDAATGLVYRPGTAFEPVPASPAGDQVAGALAALREVVADFPLPGDAHFAAWLAALLTPLARPAFDGPAPLMLIDADAPGTGKSLLADVCSTLLTGRSAARMSASRDEDEVRKQITAVALQATRLVLIDNVTGVFGSATLDRALTAERWSDRVLGDNQQVSMPLEATWFATGNNVTVRGETRRRCLRIRLEARRSHPERRTGFSQPRLLGWLRRERGRLLPAALTLLRAYAAGGSPCLDLPGWGSFEGWSDVVRSTVVWLGLPDPAATREPRQEGGGAARDPVDGLILGLDQLLPRLGGSASSREILEELAAGRSLGRYQTLCSSLADHFPALDAETLPTPAQLSAKLGSLRGRPAGDTCVEQGPRSSRGVRWSLRRVTKEVTR